MLNFVIDSQALQPYRGTDVVAFLLGIMALLFLALWRRDHERGMGWFALSMGCLAAWIASSDQRLPFGPYMVPSAWFYVLALGLGCMAVGLIEYVGVPPNWRRRALWATLLPVTVYALLLALATVSSLQLRRIWFNPTISVSFVVMGAVAWWASRREPGAGHRYIAIALWGVPIVSTTLLLARAETAALRYWGALSVLVLALTLLAVTLLRRRRALEAEVARRSAAEADLTALNASLEHVIAARTMDLRSMVEGLETFNRTVSHDLRGPLGGIAGAARLAADALERGDHAQARRLLPVIADQAEDSTRLVAALLSLAQVGDMALQRQAVDLRRMVDDVIARCALEQAGQAMPQIEVKPLPEVNADPALLQRVFVNLIGNAIKFTRGEDRARIEVGASTTRDGVEVYVHDNGVGFDAAAAERLFMPFVRLHGQRFEGHGIGLSIVRRVVERHGGRVWAESKTGQGAIFHFTLPA